MEEEEKIEQNQLQNGQATNRKKIGITRRWQELLHFLLLSLFLNVPFQTLGWVAKTFSFRCWIIANNDKEDDEV